MSIEVVASVIAGLVIGRSLSLLAFGGDSVVELISAYAVFSYLRNLDKGAFKSGLESERTERFTTSLLTLLIPIIAGGAVYSYLFGVKPDTSPLGIAVSLGAVVIMPTLWIQKRKIGRDGKILPLSIDAAESATCLFMAITVLADLLLNYFFRIAWADYVATAIILGFIALEIRESLDEMKEERE